MSWPGIQTVMSEAVRYDDVQIHLQSVDKIMLMIENRYQTTMPRAFIESRLNAAMKQIELKGDPRED